MRVIEQIEALVRDPEVPDHIRRKFAADCAERGEDALCGSPLLKEWQSLIESIRLHAEGKVTNEEIRSSLVTFRAGWEYEDASIAEWEAYSATHAAVHPSAELAASRAAHLAARAADDSSAEREWQLKHLLLLIQEHNALLLNEREHLEQALF